MRVAACLRGGEGVALWGLAPRERLRRQLATLGVTAIVARPDAPGPHEAVLIVDVGYLFEPRTLAALLRQPGSVLRCLADGRIAAAFAPAARAAEFAACVGTDAGGPPAGATELTVDTLEAYDDHLRRTTPPLLRPVTAANRDELESLLYGNAYKGITDLVTKWWWPRPARVVVRRCALRGITANAVTLTGVALMLVACACFHAGWYAAGLACGWVMTLLDTVDGKLARVTVGSSRLGHVLDHGMDILHPPVWYVLWGKGLPGGTALGWDVDTVAVAIVAGYVAGRVIEGLFHGLANCSLFAWRPFDAYARLVTARRNPCLIILTVATAAGRPDAGLIGVAAWTLLSTAAMAVRLGQAALARLRGPRLESWLRDPEARHRHPRAWRTFASTRRAYE